MSPISFAPVSVRELAKPVPPMEWLVRDVWPRQSFGPMGGEKKTLKTYNLLAMAVAVASGEAMFGEFEVAASGPVLFYVGEGGQGPFQRRLQAMARAYKVELRDLPFHAVFGVGSLNGAEFTDALHQNLDAIQPELVIIDPLYAFHPPGVEAQNLYERGRMLAELSGEVAGQSALIVADHFKKSGGAELDLDSISQAGMAQWADSWILQKHRQSPNLEAGEYQLGVEFGSRQWGGGRWDLDWHLPTVGEIELGEASAELSWTIRRADASSERSGVSGRQHANRLTRVLEVVGVHPYELTKNQLIGEVGGNRDAVKSALAELEAEGRVLVKKAKATEGDGRVVARDRYGLPAKPRKIRGNLAEASAAARDREA